MWRKIPFQQHEIDPTPTGWKFFHPAGAALRAALPCVPAKAEADGSTYTCQAERVTYFLGTVNVREMPGRQTRGAILQRVVQTFVGALGQMKGEDPDYQPWARLEYGAFQGRYERFTWGEFELLTYVLANDDLVILMTIVGNKEDLQRNESYTFFRTLQTEIAVARKKPTS